MKIIILKNLSISIIIIKSKQLKNIFFFDTLLTKIIIEHEIYELCQKFFFKTNTNYSNYI